ncbi:MAG: transposase [Chloroflexi bacterium]|nr:MAG: transposase [Chloroflexota bacterium]
MYLVAILDWFSRYVLAWQLSNTLDGRFCLDALQQALLLGRPEIFNTDQGAQFTALAFTGCLEAAGVRISMDSRGQVFDNIFIERLWRAELLEKTICGDPHPRRRSVNRPRTHTWIAPGQCRGCSRSSPR